MNSTPLSEQTLPRVLGPWIATAVVVGTVIGSGVFKKGQRVAEAVPDSGLAISAWVLVGVVTLCGALVLAEIASLFPRAGGNYEFLRRGYGPLFGFLWGWVEFWIIRPASVAALVTIFTEGAHDILKQLAGSQTEVLGFWPRQLVTCAVITILGAINLVLRAGRGSTPVTGTDLVVDSDALSGDATFNSLEVGNDATTLNDVPGIAAPPELLGDFGQQAKTVDINNLRQDNYATTAGAFSLPGLSMSFQSNGC